MLILSLAACKTEPAPTPTKDPRPEARAESAEKATPNAPDEARAPESPAPLAESPSAPEVVNAVAKLPMMLAGAGGGQEIALPKGRDGVLPPGAADKVLRVGGQPLVKLIDGGSEPRSDLSYSLQKGVTQKLQMNMDMTMSMKMGAKSLPPTTIPTMTMQLDMNTAEKSAAGEWRIDAKLTQVTISSKGGQEDQLAQAMRPQLEGMKGLAMGYWISAKGRVHDVKVDVPKSVPAAAQQLIQGMNQSFESMVAPLPNEPVGVGAKWQVVSRIASSGADILQSAIYTLKSRSGEKIALDVTLSQVAANDTIKVPGMPAGVTAEVKAFNSGGSGTNQINTKNVAPDAGSMALKTLMNLAVQAGGSKDESTIDTQTKVQISKL